MLEDKSIQRKLYSEKSQIREDSPLSRLNFYKFNDFRSSIDSYIDDNKALMRRMYGNLVEQIEPEPVVNERTPASTTLFVQRMVRNFGGQRFKRSVQEGKIMQRIVS